MSYWRLIVVAKVKPLQKAQLLASTLNFIFDYATLETRYEMLMQQLG